MIIAVVYCAAYIRSLNGSAYARTAALLCIAVCFYMFGYTIELNSSSIPQIMFWNTVEYVGIPFVSALWLSVVLMYTGHFYRYKKLLFALIYVVPFISMILRFTNEYHYLYFASVSFISEYGKVLLVKKIGPWMYVQLVHSMFMIFVTLGLLIHDFIKNKEKRIGKISLMVAASFFAVAGLILLIIKPFGFIIDYMALCLPAACLMVIVTIIRYDFLATKSMARNKAFEASRDAILLINRQNKIIDYNKSAKQLFGKININISDGYIDALFKRAPDLIKNLYDIKTTVIKLNINEKERYYEISTKSIDNSNASHGWIKTIRDITETYDLNESLKRQAMIDELSGLSNRRAFMQNGKKLLEEADKNGISVYLLMMDLDYFKRVNDQYGHLVGDQVIQNFANILKESFDSKSLIARLGGEEFGVLLTGGGDMEIKQKVDLVLRNVEQYQHIYLNKKFHVTVSIGVVKKSYSTQTLDSLMRLADKALYKSKDNGRNRATVL